MIDDQKIRQALIAREPQALEQVMDAYAGLLWSVAQSVLHTDSAQEIEECAADVFFELWQKPEAYDPAKASLKTYLATAIRYKAIDRCRKLSRDSTFSLRENDIYNENIAEALEREEEAKALKQAVQELPEPEREIVNRRFYQGQKAGEISDMMSLDVRQVQNRLYRAKQRLRHWWVKKQRGEE
ncbi:RNA polymerase sigma factor [Saccharibacillus sacchari]|uniref:RNA polymerase sigma factor n=1 Tax=Saccharibacillus sacchari TaxID=456493 RepID=UPI0004B2B4A4|nr:sigma-70 family RNA polymerase sigma factor [Saccharibacillus sacchari]